MLNYGRCIGTDQSVREGTGLFAFGYFDQPIRAADVTDGLSNTAAFAEILLGSASAADPRRPIWAIEKTPVTGQGTAYAEICRSLPKPDTRVLDSGRGSAWYAHPGPISAYNHLLPPNTRSCNWKMPVGQNAQSWDFGVFNSASGHSGGVHAALADGSVRFVSDAIDLAAWRAIGTRAGGEAGTF